MKPLNTLAIENFLEKARIARKSNQKSLTLTISEVEMLEEAMSAVLIRLAGELDQKFTALTQLQNTTTSMDGGGF